MPSARHSAVSRHGLRDAVGLGTVEHGGGSVVVGHPRGGCTGCSATRRGRRRTARPPSRGRSTPLLPHTSRRRRPGRQGRRRPGTTSARGSRRVPRPRRACSSWLQVRARSPPVANSGRRVGSLAVQRSVDGPWGGGVASPLSDIRVVELTSWMAAPSAGAVLADLGADVVKVEPLTGDPVRGMTRQPKPVDGTASFDASFLVDNRGKRSVAVAVDRPEGADLVRRLVQRCDVFLCNLLLRRQRRFGLDAPALLALQPRLVHATFTGYGLVGPRRRATRLRRDCLLRARCDHRRDGRAGRRRAGPAPRPGRPRRRHRARWPGSSPRCASSSAPAKARSSTPACSAWRHGRWPPTWRRP